VRSDAQAASGKGGTDVTVLRAAPLPPPDDRFQPSYAIRMGLRESRAMAVLAADLVSELGEARPGDIEPIRTRLREVIEIGSARDTGGPLAALYAAARRDAGAALARVLSRAPGDDPQGFAASLVEVEQELRRLDERFAERDFALTSPIGALIQPAPVPGTQAAGLNLIA
jgi:hypothetical protein